MQCKWQVEIDDYCRRVLAKHWPDVRRWDDVRTFPPEPIDEWKVDVICGGFPCQDISYAGKGAGINGDRSRLFFELARVVRTLGPRIVVLENVAALLNRGMGEVLGTLASLGYDTEWTSLDAKTAGIPHRGRDRTFLVAYRASMFRNGSNNHGLGGVKVRSVFPELGNGRCETLPRVSHWASDHPRVLRMADGIPDRMDRLCAIGNAVVPQVAEWIGRRIVEATNNR